MTHTDDNEAVMGSAAALSGLPVHLARKAFGALSRAGARANAPAPSPDQAAVFLRERRDLLKTAEGLDANILLVHKVGLSQARERAEGGACPDGATWYAWQRLLDECQDRARLRRRAAVIFDIDGTLSDNSPMKDLDFPVAPPGQVPCFDEWMSHTVDLEAHSWVRDATHEVAAGTVRVIITARSEKYREITLAWLGRHGVAYDVLIMRPNDDPRPDQDYKQDVLDRLERNLDFVFAMDDNPQVAQMWRNNDITTIVVPGYDVVHAPDPSKAATG